MKRFAAVPIAVGLLASLVATAPAGVAAPSPKKPKVDWLLPVGDVAKTTKQTFAGKGAEKITGDPTAGLFPTPGTSGRHKGASAGVAFVRDVGGQRAEYSRGVAYGVSQLDSGTPDVANAWCRGTGTQVYPYKDGGCWSLGSNKFETLVTVFEPFGDHYLVWSQVRIDDIGIVPGQNSLPSWPTLSYAGLFEFASRVQVKQKAKLTRVLSEPVEAPKPSEPAPIRDLAVSNFDVKNGLTTFDVRFAGAPGASYLVGLTDENGNEITGFQTVELETCPRIIGTNKYIGGCDIANATVTFPNDAPAAVLNISNKPTSKERAYNMSVLPVSDPYSFAMFEQILEETANGMAACARGKAVSTWQMLPGDREDIKATYDQIDRLAAGLAAVAATYAAQTSYIDAGRAGYVTGKWTAQSLNQARKRVTSFMRKDLDGVASSRFPLLPDPTVIQSAAKEFVGETNPVDEGGVADRIGKRHGLACF